jgi:WD40 repeat protein
LRPFERYEADVFFGRETQVDAMVDRLGRRRLLAVTGGSGCGKSSLVRAGLLEALETGLLATAGPVWRFATSRPGGHPMTELAAALITALGGPRTEDDLALWRARLERGPLSLIEELNERPLSDSGNLLILVDQFEELFRYRSLTGREEAEAFVALLLASAEQEAVPIYIVLTMRSDFLGRCAEFDGLAEAVSDAQYLCPRLSRDQIRSAIEGPAEVFGGKVEARLTSRIVNDMGTDPDQLPLMQHALMRLWELARARAPNAPQLRLVDYDAEGGIKGSLSRHADEILTQVARDGSQRAETARRLFCLLTEGEGENAVRRLAEVKEVVEVTGSPLDEVAAVADSFRAPGRSLLMPGLDRPLTPETVLDISHESLIRQWQTLRDWVRAEAVSAEHYRDNERRARRWRAGSAGFLDGIDLDVALVWHEREHPAPEWAARYGGDFTLAMRFLNESRERRDRLAREAADERAAAATRLAERFADAQLYQSRFLTEKAREALRDEQLETAKVIALAALPDDISAPDRPVWFPAVSVLADARSRDRQRAVLQGHTGRVTSAGFSPDGARIVTASDDNAARLWDAATGATLAVLQGHTDPVNGARFSPDGTRVVTASRDNTARLWDATAGDPLAVLQGHRGSVNSAVFSLDAAQVATASDDNTGRLWDAATGSPLAVLQGHTGSINSAAFSPDGTRVVTASRDNTARLWDSAAGDPLAVLQGHTGSVNSAAFSLDAARVATASDDNTGRLWDAATGSPLVVLQGHTGSINSAAFSPDGTRVVTASRDKTARLWDAATGAPLAVLQGHTGFVNSAAFGPDGVQVVTVSDDNSARLWDAATGASLAVLKGHTGGVNSAVFNPDGARVVTVSNDNTVRLWDATSDATLAVLQGHRGSVNSAVFSLDAARVATASDDNTARLWDAATGATLTELQGHKGSVNSVAFSPDGTRVVTASRDNTARLWDAAAGDTLAVLQGHKGSVNSAAFSPDGAWVATASRDNTSRLWNTATGASLAVLEGHKGSVNSAEFSPDGARIVTASDDNTARLWDAATGVSLSVLQGHTGSVNSAVFSPNGARVATACDDNTARLWDAATGASLVVLQEHAGFVNSAAFGPDGARVATVSDDKTARLWDAATGASLAVLQGHAGPVYCAGFSPDGTRVVTASDDNTARLWAVWPMLTAETVAYARISALRGLSRHEQESLFLTEANAAEVMATADDPGAVCDRLAGDPFDPGKCAPGVPFDAIDAEKAVLACRAAVEEKPNEPRFRYQLGRALDRADERGEAAAVLVRSKAEQDDIDQLERELGRALYRAVERGEAADLVRSAAEKRYPAALNYLGLLHEIGRGVPEDYAEALRLCRLAAESGYAPAFSDTARLYRDCTDASATQPDGPHDPAAELDRANKEWEWLERGAAQGDAFSHRRLGARYETGDHLPRDLERGLLHYAIATRLFEVAEDEPDATTARARRGSLARALPPEVAVRVAHQAGEWRKR